MFCFLATRRLARVSALLVLFRSAVGEAAEPVPQALEGVTVVEKLGKSLDLDLEFRNHRGKRVRLADYIDGKLPVLLTLNYYRCPMLCNLQLNALTERLKQMEWVPGKEFRVVMISIDPKEKPDLALEKRTTYLRALGRGWVDWSFLTGSQQNITRVTQALGFGYTYDEKSDQYGHPAVAFFISPQGRVTRYLYGIEFTAREVKLALVDASSGKLGSVVDKLILSCFRYDPAKGRYTPFAVGMMRLGGGVTIGVLAFFWIAAWLRQRRCVGEKPA